MSILKYLGAIIVLVAGIVLAVAYSQGALTNTLSLCVFCAFVIGVVFHAFSGNFLKK